MSKQEFIKERKDGMYFEYDKTKYDIEYSEDDHMILLTRLSDNKVLEIFEDKISFIIQSYVDRKANFLIADWEETDKKKKWKIKHYIDKFSNFLILQQEFDSQHGVMEQCRIANLDNVYVIEQENSSIIYNLNSGEYERFAQVYNDEEVTKFFDDNTLLVNEVKSAFQCKKNKVSDTLTYGINPETFAITTPIWSELQHRFINIYTQEQVDKINESLKEKGIFFDTSYYSLSEITIRLEIEVYLWKLELCLADPQNVYSYNEVNENFVKKFVKKK